MEGLIGDIPWGIGYRSEKFGLVSLNDSYVGLRSTSPKFYSIRPHWFQHCFIDEKLVFQRQGVMFSNEPVYLASFEVKLLVSRCHVVLPG